MRKKIGKNRNWTPWPECWVDLRLQNSFSRTTSIQRKLFSLVSVIYFVSLNLCSLAIRPRLPSFHTIKKINNLKTLTLTIDSVSAISLSSQRTRCFNNVILHLNEIKIKNAVVNRNYPCQSSPFIHRDERTVSVWVRQKTIETVDWRPRKLGFQHREKTRRKLIEGAC